MTVLFHILFSPLVAFGLVQTPLVLAAWLLSGYFRTDHWSAKASVAFVLYTSMATISAWLLAVIGLLNQPAALGLSLAILLVAGYLRRDDLACAQKTAPETSDEFPRKLLKQRWLELLAAVAVLSLAGGILYMFLALPPLGFDSLMYHLHFPATWLQHGRLVRTTIPLVHIAGVEYYPVNGEMLYAWWMLPTSDDSIAKTLQVAFFVSLFATLTLGAREMGGHAGWSALGATTCLLIRPILRGAELPYTDLIVSYSLVAAAVFFIRSFRHSEELLLSGLALGMCMATKSVGIVLAVAFLVPAVSWLALRRERDWMRRGGLFGAGLLLVGAPSYVWNWVTTGNPLYPVEVKFAGMGIFDGFFPRASLEALGGYAEAWHAVVAPNVECLVVGSAVCLAGSLLAVFVLAFAGRDRFGIRLDASGFVAAVAVLGIVLVTEFVPALGEHRVFTPSLVLMCLFIALLVGACGNRRPRVAGAIALASIALNASWPVVRPLLVPIAVCAALIAMGTYLATRLNRQGRIALCVLTAVSGCYVVSLRLDTGLGARYQMLASIYGELGEGWWAMDQLTTAPGACTIAHVTECPYPLLGTDWRNRAVYVPVTPSGAMHLHQMPDSPEPTRGDTYAACRLMRTPGTYEAWLERLRATGARYLFYQREHDVEAGGSPELDWAREHPEVLQAVFANHAVVIFRILPEASLERP